jgi:glycosyltransferase involved in cell wall biosynthesis
MRVAVVHDWLNGMRGGEKVLEAILELYPQADVFTLIADPHRLSPAILSRRIFVSFLQKIPGALRYYRHLLPLMPWAVSTLDVSRYDLVISSSHCVAKGVRRSRRAVHVSYVHAPMRYMWFRFEDYFGKKQVSFWVRLAAQILRPWIQGWDRRVSQANRVDALVANSRFIASQIDSAYSRTAEVVHPFVDLARFSRPRDPKDFCLMVGAFAPNKRVDLAIEAFNQLGRRLLIVGNGQEENRLRKMAGPTIEFLGEQSGAKISELYSQCQAFIFPGVEDFGITPLEAMASGAPVVAFAQGGALETVTEETGVFFSAQDAGSLIEAISTLEKNQRSGKISESACRSRAQLFTRDRFKREFLEIINRAVLVSMKSRAQNQ